MRKLVMTVVLLFLACGGMAHAFDPDNIEIHGFASTGYIKSEKNNYLLLSEDGSFEFNEAGINVTTALSDNIRVGMQLFSRDLGDVGNNDIELDWAFLDYHWNEALGLRAGRIKIPMGLYNDTRDYDMLRTSIFLPQGVYNVYFREAEIAYQGAGLYGNLSLAAAGRLGYDLYGGAMEVKPDSIMAKYVSDAESILTSATIDRMAGGRIRWYTPLQGLMLGSSFIQLQMVMNFESPSAPVYINIDIPTMQFLTLSAEYDFGNWTLAAEYNRWKYDSTTMEDLSRIEQPSPPQLDETYDSDAYYVLLSYRFTDWFEAGAYYTVFYDDRDDRDGDNLVQQGLPDYYAWQKDLALSARFDITDSWLIKLETHFMNGSALGDFSDNPDGFEEDWTLFAVKSTFNF